MNANSWQTMHVQLRMLDLGDLGRLRSRLPAGPFVFTLIAAYLLSLFLPVIDIHVEAVGWGPVCLPFMGYDCLNVFPGGLLHPWWWPNILFLLGLGFLVAGRWSVAGWCGVIATVLASTVTVLVLVYFLGEFADGHRVNARFRFPLRTGYFVWLGCMIGLTCSARQLKLHALQLGSHANA